ncbi:hypothetical protein MJO28_013901 [Puccinia striiformis f. sp. tritici]|uniref:Uncharacterized protein n=3 Tax=Puccinia striiformis TaxID=27350 RepID=A0A0L0V7R4_9BASI|nr:hypothetical protein Pst134EB_026205 [Puccinia striiformis f. sp. tritici]KAI9627320.1 hypothetical protein KEM48_009947 [Puccinia striiformis f. sp. tritici PST-130]KNE95355.1 hypothetical protein PSTG_11339 [Puccinia striiformis f. sp. tritici PST-78]POW04087.1 hypothetical protein PSTT_10633 [Puccinia striiformis]KAH9443817.1 hypothetical protein Pst134EB_026210 [Puccinia striiformis f. sp. tritici]
MEYLIQSSRTTTIIEPSKQEEEEEGEGERDEYGLKHSPTTTTSSSSTTKEFKIGGSKISKPLPTQQEQKQQTLLDHHHPLLLRLHELILDHHSHVELDQFLSQSSKDCPIPKYYSDLINGYLNGYTAFHQACDIGDLDIVKCLCRAGVDRQLLDRTDGLSGIELAREAGREEVVEFLADL